MFKPMIVLFRFTRNPWSQKTEITVSFAGRIELLPVSVSSFAHIIIAGSPIFTRVNLGFVQWSWWTDNGGPFSFLI